MGINHISVSPETYKNYLKNYNFGDKLMALTFAERNSEEYQLKRQMRRLRKVYIRDQKNLMYYAHSCGITNQKIEDVQNKLRRLELAKEAKEQNNETN